MALLSLTLKVTCTSTWVEWSSLTSMSRTCIFHHANLIFAYSQGGRFCGFYFSRFVSPFERFYWRITNLYHRTCECATFPNWQPCFTRENVWSYWRVWNRIENVVSIITLQSRLLVSIMWTIHPQSNVKITQIEFSLTIPHYIDRVYSNRFSHWLLFWHIPCKCLFKRRS